MEYDRLCTVYHGTKSIYRDSLMNNIKISKSNKNLDFGQGFYTTTNFQQALSFAQDRTYKHNQKVKNQSITNFPIYLAKPMVMVYNINIDKLKKCSKNLYFENPNKEWCEFIFNNRLGEKYSISSFHNLNLTYDWVFGHIADGKIPIVLKQYKKGKLKYNDFHEKIKPFNPINEDQLSLHTKEAIDCLELINVGIYEEKRGELECLFLKTI